ncbi:hypothetical protein [Geomonas subterranea]|uniref:hypothetical protein n=1 Tax=Geomonas subterranea TaxID=2847989 RepID=UPI001CD59FBF|nr:hypothetical protein [Geomonas fuzhouensis]
MSQTIRSQLLWHLEKLPPLSPITLTELYKLPFVPQGKEHAVRAALYGVCVGRTVSVRQKPKKFYGIRLELHSGKEVVLSLPGLPREALNLDHGHGGEVNRIIKRLEKGYGKMTIGFWVKSSQRRSVEQAASAMRKAKARDIKACRLCEVEGQTEPRRVRACHLVSRRSSFWRILDEVERTKGAIFTDDVSLLLDKRLRELEVHSDSNFIVTLCKEHDDLLLATLARAFPRPAVGGSQITLYGAETAKASPEVPILKLGGEGGSIVLLGKASLQGHWTFLLRTEESTVLDLLDEDLGGEKVKVAKPRWAKGWKAGLKILSQYPWVAFYPLEVHREFAVQILKEVLLRDEQCDKETWLNLCYEAVKGDLHQEEEILYLRKQALLVKGFKHANEMDADLGVAGLAKLENPM